MHRKSISWLPALLFVFGLVNQCAAQVGSVEAPVGLIYEDNGKWYYAVSRFTPNAMQECDEEILTKIAVYSQELAPSQLGAKHDGIECVKNGPNWDYVIEIIRPTPRGVRKKAESERLPLHPDIYFDDLVIKTVSDKYGTEYWECAAILVELPKGLILPFMRARKLAKPPLTYDGVGKRFFNVAKYKDVIHYEIKIGLGRRGTRKTLEFDRLMHPDGTPMKDAKNARQQGLKKKPAAAKGKQSQQQKAKTKKSRKAKKGKGKSKPGKRKSKKSGKAKSKKSDEPPNARAKSKKSKKAKKSKKRSRSRKSKRRQRS